MCICLDAIFEPLTVTFRCIGPNPEGICLKLREIPSGRGEGPSYMKVPHVCIHIQDISSHICTVFGVGVYRIRRTHLNVIVYVCTCVCIELELKTLL